MITDLVNSRKETGKPEEFSTLATMVDWPRNQCWQREGRE